jgi:adenylate cyclase 10
MGPKEKQVQTVLTSGDFDFLQTLNKYVPSLVDSSQQSKDELPKVQAMDTIVLISDISGFTKVSEACTNQGIRGNEELAFVINRYMEGMVRNIRKCGGDVIKIVGDTMIVMWPEEKAPHDVSDSQKQQSYRNFVRKAIECALDIQNEINGFQVKSDVSSLSV